MYRAQLRNAKRGSIVPVQEAAEAAALIKYCILEWEVFATANGLLLRYALSSPYFLVLT